MSAMTQLSLLAEKLKNLSPLDMGPRPQAVNQPGRKQSILGLGFYEKPAASFAIAMKTVRTDS